jgi:hypothetical protein
VISVNVLQVFDPQVSATQSDINKHDLKQDMTDDADTTVPDTLGVAAVFWYSLVPQFLVESVTRIQLNNRPSSREAWGF